MKGLAKVQHIVPQFLLKNFADKNHRVWVYDKSNDKCYGSNIRNVVCEQGFYNFNLEIEGKKVFGTIEEKLSEIEGRGSKVIEKILKENTICNLSEQERYDLSWFISAQFNRTRSRKENIRLLPRLTRDKVKQIIPAKMWTEKEEKQFADPSPEEINFYFDKHIADMTGEYLPYFYKRIWILGKNETNQMLYCSDNPVTIENPFSSKDSTPYVGRVGLGVRGTEIYFPLSPKRILILKEPLQWNKMKNDMVLKNMKTLDMYSRADLDCLKQFGNVADYYRAVEQTQEFLLTDRYVFTMNALQIMQSERQVISMTKDFSIVSGILQCNENYRHGARVSVG